MSAITNMPDPQQGSMAFHSGLLILESPSETTQSASHSGVKYSPIECRTDLGIIPMYKSLKTSTGS